jgi:hypothetical protein
LTGALTWKAREGTIPGKTRTWAAWNAKWAGKWIAQIYKDGVGVHLGEFACETAAAVAYTKAQVAAFGAFAISARALA